MMLKVLRWAPIVYCINGAWAYSNQQAFRNAVHVSKGDYLFGPANHELYQFLFQVTPGSVFLYVPVTYTIGYMIYKCCLRRCATRLDEKHLRDNFYHIDDSQLADEYIDAQDSLKHSRQNLQPFFEALRNYQIGAMLKEEKVCREILGINRFSDETLLKLKDEAAKRKRQKFRRSAFWNPTEKKGTRNL